MKGTTHTHAQMSVAEQNRKHLTVALDASEETDNVNDNV